MDTLTHAALGAVVAIAAGDKSRLRPLALVGALAAVSPDLDVLISTAGDPLHALVMHRHFSHALLFSPIGALLCAALVYYPTRNSLTWRDRLLACWLGYLSHSLLDACTAYGTLLWWPFSEQRVAWNVVADIDPLASLPLWGLAIMALVGKRVALVYAGLTWFGLYLLFGLFQTHRVEQEAIRLANFRGHKVESVFVMPSFANNLVWKTIYRVDDSFHVDAIRAGWQMKVYPGGSVSVLAADKRLDWLDSNSQQATDLRQFEWLSMGYLSVDHSNPRLVWDMRYSLLPNDVEGSLAIVLDPQAESTRHVDSGQRPMTSAILARLWNMILGR